MLDEATGKWGIKVNRVELKSIDPPASIKDSMEKQMRADRDKRAAILTAEGFKQSQILTAEGEKQSAILKAEGQAPGRCNPGDGQREGTSVASRGSSQGDRHGLPSDSRWTAGRQLLRAYQYLQMLPQIAQGNGNTIWMLPSELTDALGQIKEIVRPAAESSSSDGGA